MNPIESCKIQKLPREFQRSPEMPKESPRIFWNFKGVLETEVTWYLIRKKAISWSHIEVKIHRMGLKKMKKAIIALILNTGNFIFHFRPCWWELSTEQAYCAPVLHKSYIVTVATTRSTTSGNLGLEKATTKHMKAIKVQDKYPNIFTIIQLQEK